MTIDEVLILLKATLPNQLTSLQEFVLRSTWEGKTYTDMAQEAYYGEERIRKVAANMWQILTHICQVEIRKSNFRKILEKRKTTRKEQQLIDGYERIYTYWEFPNGPVPLDSIFYIPRPPLENTVNLAITEPGGAVCLKSPKKMGKSSLILRLLAHADSLGYHKVSLDLQQADSNLCTSLDLFLRWFAANISRELGIEGEIDRCWNASIGSKVSCSIFLENHILPRLDTPLLLVLNELDWILNYPAIASDFILLLQSWYERAKQLDIWQKLRLVVAYSSEILVPLNLIPSPIDLGLCVTLTPFNRQQVQTLAKSYRLDWFNHSHIDQLMDMLGGHPYLLRLAMYYLAKDSGDETNLIQLIEQASTENGIYKDFFRQYLLVLQAQPELAAALETAIASREPVYLEPVIACKLQNLGLIHIERDRCIPSCELYRRYFRPYLTSHINQKLVQTLEQENYQLREQTNRDKVTQIANRSYFQTYLESEWQSYLQAGNNQINLALIICDIDYFDYYNRIYGNTAGDNCLQLIAKTINNCIQQLQSHHPVSALLARYRDEQFAIILNTETILAATLAETIREQIKNLGIPCEYPGIGGLPASVLTVSLGVSSVKPTADRDGNTLISNAQTALYLAKRRGRDRVAIA